MFPFKTLTFCQEVGNYTLCFKNAPLKRMICGHTCCRLCFYNIIDSGCNNCHICHCSFENDVDLQIQLELNRANAFNNMGIENDKIRARNYENDGDGEGYGTDYSDYSGYS